MYWTLLCASKHKQCKQDMLPPTNKTCSLPQTAGGKDEQNIVYMRKLQWTSQDGTQNVKTLVKTTIYIIRDVPDEDVLS